MQKADQMQIHHYYAIVDEVDSVLVDEARTPLIISGPVQGSSKNEIYSFLRNKVDDLVRKQKRMINDFMNELGKNKDQAEDDGGDAAPDHWTRLLPGFPGVVESALSKRRR